MVINDIKTYKALLILSLVFFIGFLVFGIIPYFLINESLWDQSIAFKGIGIIYGLSFIISMISYIYLAISTLKPYNEISNYIKIVSSLMLFSLFNFILPDESGLSDSTRIIIFIVFGLMVIISNVIFYLKEKRPDKDNRDAILNKYNLSDKNTITNEKDGIFLFNLIFFAILMLSFSNEDMSSIPVYIMIILLNSFILYNFIKATNSTIEEIKIIITAAIILTIFTITLLEVTPNIVVSKFGNFEIIFALMPSIYWFPKILKNYYIITWNKNYE